MIRTKPEAPGGQVMYKDKDKQREAIKQATQRYRAKKGDSALLSSKAVSQNARGLPVVDEVGDTQPVIPPNVIPKRGKDIKYFDDLPADVQQTIDQMSLVDGRIDKTVKAKRTLAAIKYQHLFPESYEPGHMEITRAEAVVMGKPGDVDYNGICTPEWRAERGR